MDEGRSLRSDDGRWKSQRAALSAAIGLRFEVGGKKGGDPGEIRCAPFWRIYLRAGRLEEGPSAVGGLRLEALRSKKKISADQ